MNKNMMIRFKRLIVCGLALAACAITVWAGTVRAAEPLPEPFAEKFRLARKVMMEIEPDNLTWMFRVTAGLDSLENTNGICRLRGWEAPNVELRGHTCGHWLSGMANVIKETGDPEAKRRSAEVVHTLALCQKALGSGYVSAFPESFIDRIIAGRRVWAPWYTLHKILAGLLDQYEKAGNDEALAVAEAFGDWTWRKLEPLTPRQLEKMRAFEFGGIADALWHLYGITRKREYAKAAECFFDPTVMDDLTAHRDRLASKHLNTFVPKVLGEMRKWKLTGDAAARDRAEFFFKTVVEHHMYAPGCFSDREHCFMPDTQGQHLTGVTGEACVTYNMLKLAKALYDAEPREWIMDFIERAVLNHMLAQQEPQEGRVTYFLPMVTGGYKLRNLSNDAFWCCVGSAMESQTGWRKYLFALRHLDPKTYAFRLESVPAAPDRVALFYGPWLMAGCLGTEGMRKDATRSINYYHHDYTIPKSLKVVPLGDISKLKPYDEVFDKRDYPAERKVTFAKSRLAFVNENGIVVKPLCEINGERYVVYWNK